MIDPTLFTPVADNTLLTYGNGTLIAQGDDNSERFDITEVFENGFSFGSRTFEELFLSTNGGVSFIDQTISFTASLENTNFVIAPFLDDLDNRTLPPGATPGIYFDINTARDSLVMTWDGVGIFSNDVTSPNTFQLEIMDLGGGDSEIIFRYFDMGNSRGNTFQAGAVADGGPRVFLRGGSSSDELGTAANIDTLLGNTGIAGVWQYRIIDGQLQPDDLLGDTETGNGNPNTINGTDRNDVISGGAGNDTISGRLGIDRLNGDEGNDSIFGEGDDDILHGGADDDTVDGGSGDDTVFGDEGNDRLVGGSGVNELDGGSGADTLIGTGGSSFASYGSSTSGLTVDLNNTGANTGDAVGDTYTNITDVIGSGFADDITGTNQNNILRGGAGNDALTGDDGNDTLFGEDGDDVLNGGDGNDELVGGAGADNLLGGPGSDAASYRDASSGVTADLEDRTTNTGEAAGDTYSSIENLIGSNEDDILRGNSTANRIDGLDGNDLLLGRAGDDTLNGNNGDDTLNGGEGADDLDGGRGINTASYADATSRVDANLSNSGSNSGEATGDSYSNIQNLIGSGFDDVLTGDSQKNLLEGGAGDDRLNGASGDDTLRGGAGADDLRGSSGSDTADYSQASGGVSANLTDSSGNTGDARGDTYSSIENLMGTEFGDTLTDDTSNNQIFGLGGDDLINSRGGTDSFDGGEGSDTVAYVDTGFVTVDLEDNSANGGDASGDTFTSIEHLFGTDNSDDLFGDANDNFLFGGGNNDELNGRAGADTLRGGAGNDQLTGGTGGDTFVLENGMGDDTVTDFVLGQDSLDYSALSSAERDGVTFSANGSGDRVVTLADGSTLTMTGVARNSGPTGTPSITGTARQGETLTAETGSIVDLDGLGALSLQWKRGGVNIDGATNATYQLGQADVGQAITVEASYRDGFGTDETVTSTASTSVENVNDAPTGAVTISGGLRRGETLTADRSGVADADGIDATTESSQWMRGGVAIAGATNDTYVLTADDVGQGISIVFAYTDNFGTAESVTSAATTPIANIPNSAATGAVVVSGTLRVGQTLSSDVSAVEDANGINEATEAGQWMRDGVAIAGETGETYVLTEDDLGAAITLVFTFTDNLGNPESITSAATTPIESAGLNLVGTPGPDVLTGGIGNDTISGLDDADRLIGNDGDDRLLGGDGPDTLNGGNGNDTIQGGATSADLRDVIFGGEGDDSIDAGFGNDQVFGQGGNDSILGGFGADELQGQDGNDVITGGALSDLVFGGAGNDFVNGGFGHDRINGGSGEDTFFHLGIADHGSDWLQDYNAAEGDVLLFGDASVSADNFQINLAHTANAAGERSGDDAVQEAFVIFKPTEQIIWALVDGAGQDEINLKIGDDIFNIA